MMALRERWLRWRLQRATRALARAQTRCAAGMQQMTFAQVGLSNEWQVLDYPEPTGPDPGVPENRSEPLCPDGHDWMWIGYGPEGSSLRYCVRCGRQEHTTPPTV